MATSSEPVACEGDLIGVFCVLQILSMSYHCHSVLYDM